MKFEISRDDVAISGKREAWKVEVKQILIMISLLLMVSIKVSDSSLHYLYTTMLKKYNQFLF